MEKISMQESLIGLRGLSASFVQLLVTLVLAKARLEHWSTAGYIIVFYAWVILLALPVAVNGVLPASGLIDPIVERLPRGRRYEQAVTVALATLGVMIAWGAPWALLWAIMQLKHTSSLVMITICGKVALAWVGIQIALVHFARVGWRRRESWSLAFKNASVPATN